MYGTYEPICSEGDCSPFDIGLVIQKGFNNLFDEGKAYFKNNAWKPECVQETTVSGRERRLPKWLINPIFTNWLAYSKYYDCAFWGGGGGR